MLQLQSFTFNAFQENTYVLYDDGTKECFVVDPGCSNPSEEEKLRSFINDNGLTPIRLINTHCHIDHVLGNKFISEHYNLSLEAHSLEVSVLASGTQVSQMYGIPYQASPLIATFLEEGEQLQLGSSKIDILLTPGHSPGSISFLAAAEKILLSGDVLFMSSIGRTDLPGGDYDTLIGSIATKLLPLDDDVKVYSGHGPSTTIGYERANNPFLGDFR